MNCDGTLLKHNMGCTADTLHPVLGLGSELNLFPPLFNLFVPMLCHWHNHSLVALRDKSEKRRLEKYSKRNTSDSTVQVNSLSVILQVCSVATGDLLPRLGVTDQLSTQVQ